MSRSSKARNSGKGEVESKLDAPQSETGAHDQQRFQELCTLLQRFTSQLREVSDGACRSLEKYCDPPAESKRKLEATLDDGKDQGNVKRQRPSSSSSAKTSPTLVAAASSSSSQQVTSKEAGKAPIRPARRVRLVIVR